MDATDIERWTSFVQQDESFFKFLFEHLEDAIITTSFDGTVLYWNAMATKLYGFSAEEMIGNPIEKSGPVFDMSVFEANSKSGNLVNKGEWSKEIDGEMRTFNVVTTILQNAQGEFSGIMGVSKDITVQKKLDEELREALTTADELSKMKSAYLSNLSHEIKTPMASIIGLAELIQSTTANEEVNNYAQIQKDSCQRLLATMESILEMSKMDSKEARFSSKVCNINEILQDLMAPFQALAKKKNLDFTFEDNGDKVLVLIDPFVLNQIVTNILSNAVKYTNEGGIHITVKMCDENINDGGIIIKDTGIGMDDEFLKKLFEPFTREERAEVKDKEGSGLGLSIAYQYVRMLGWKLEVHTEKGHGSVFRVVFPLFDPREITKI